MKYQITKEELVKYLNDGLSSRDIEQITNIKYWNINYYIQQYGIQDLNKYKKVQYDEDFFHKIDTKEKAYILGFLIADGYISKDNKFELAIMLSDKEVLDFMTSCFGGKVRVVNITNKSKKIFPNCSIKIGNKKIIKNLKMLFGGRLKEERRIPIIKKELEPYLVQGFFDADGCITWGIRKDRDRIWQKVSFTSQYKLLIGIQSILAKNGITTSIRPKSNAKCFVLEIASKNEVLKMLDFIYTDKDFIVLHRKYEKANALRLELGEFGGSLNG